MPQLPLQFFDYVVQPGERISLALPTPELYTPAKMHIPIHILHGKKEGPCLLVCGALHGDALNGIEIIHRFLAGKSLKSIKGTIIAIPSVNVYGLVNQTRNLPDRRDLDGSFPGHEKGSFASRLAYTINQEVLSKADYIIDLHTGEQFFQHLPQIHTNLDFPEAERLAKAFQAPILVHSNSKRGMLWQLYQQKPIPTLIFETGEAWRLDSVGIRYGVRGLNRVLHELGMITSKTIKSKPPQSARVVESRWVRSSSSGLAHIHQKLGGKVSKGDKLFTLSDPFGTSKSQDVYCDAPGVIITINRLSLVNEGEPLMEIGILKEPEMELDLLELKE